MGNNRRLAFLVALAVACLDVSGTARIPSFAQTAPKQQKVQSVVERQAVLRGFSDWVTSVAFSPDGKILAVGSHDVVKLWDAASKSELAVLDEKRGYAKSLMFSADGKRLAAGGYQTVTLWDVETKEPAAVLKGHRGYVTGVAFSPDGRILATSSEDETVRLWDLSEGGTASQILRGHTYPVLGVAVSPDGKLVASAAGDETRVTKPGEVKLWDAATGAELSTLVAHKKAATGVAFSPDGKFLVSTSVDETINVYEMPSGKAVGFFAGHSRPTTGAVFAANSRTVISSSGGRAQGKNEIKVWNVETGEELAGAEGHESRIAAIALSPDRKTLATASFDQTAALWDVAAVLGAAVPLVASNAAGEKPATTPAAGAETQKTLRAGIIGLDTSHVVAFTKILNDPNAAQDVAGCRVVAAYPQGSPDIESSVSRVPGYTAEVKAQGVEIVDSIPGLLEKVDVVLLETNDGRPHWEQVVPVVKSGKRVFIDKPIAGSLTDAVAIFELAKRHKVPLFSSSSLRFAEGALALRNGKIGPINGCDAYSPCSLEKTHPDLFWYGIHGVESLFTVMGTGCQSVTRVHTAGIDVAVGVWGGDRVGTFRGIRVGSAGYGGTAFGEKGIEPIGTSGGYRPLLVEIVKFFRTGMVPVSEDETLEIYAFMEAADESKRQGGVPVTLASVLLKAREAALQKVTAVE